MLSVAVWVRRTMFWFSDGFSGIKVPNCGLMHLAMAIEKVMVKKAAIKCILLALNCMFG